MAIHVRATPAQNTPPPITAWAAVISGFVLLFGAGGVLLRVALAGGPVPDHDCQVSADRLHVKEAATEDVPDHKAEPPALAKEIPAVCAAAAPVQQSLTTAKQPEPMMNVGFTPALLPAAKPAEAPTPVVKAKQPAIPESFALKRRQHLSDEELERLLAMVPEIDIDRVPQTSARLQAWAKIAQAQNRQFSGPVLLRNERRDLAGLPFRLGLDCRAGKEAAENLHVLSRKLRGHMHATLPTDGSDCRIDAERLRELLLIRGAVPARNQPLPAAPNRTEYYERGGVFVRADVTYLKQDFSAMLAIPNPGPWPAYQRYDYVIRKRPATALELSLAKKRPASYPQRESVGFVLRELSGAPCKDLKIRGRTSDVRKCES